MLGRSPPATMKIRRLVPLAVVLLVVVIGLFLSLDALAKAAVEHAGTSALGVETRLESADIGVFSGEFRLRGLAVANPEGFEEEHFLALDEGYLELSLASLAGERIEAPLLELSGISIALERSLGGTNYGVILDHMGSGEEEAPPEGEPQGEPDSGSGKAFVIDRIVIRDVEARVRLSAAGIGTGATISIDEITIEDMGEREYTIAELSSLVVRTLLAAVLRSGGLPSELGAGLESSLAGLGGVTFQISGETVKLVEGSEAVIEEASEVLRGLFDRGED